MLSRLVYVSSRKRNCTEQEVDNILKTSQKNNGNLNVTGLLLYNEERFLQCLEGEYQDVMALYDVIKADTRHQKVALIQLSGVTERLFPLWAMANKKMDLEDVEFSSRMNDLEKREFVKIFKGEIANSDKILDIIGKVL